MTREVDVAVVGLGRMGALHARNVARARGARLVGVADADPHRVEQLSRVLGVAGFATLDDLLEGASPEALVVASPSPTHAAAIEMAARRGIHVLCEKPLSSDIVSGERAVAAANAAGIKVQVGFQMRFDRDLARLATLVQSGELGELYQFRASLRDAEPPPREYIAASGGYFWDSGIHCFDLARWLMGDVVEVTAVGASLSASTFAELGDVDNAVVVLRFASGALGHVDLCRAAEYGFDAGVELVGERGAARVPGGVADGLERLDRGRVVRAHVVDFMERFEPTYADELAAFVASVADGTPCLVAGEDGLAAMRIAAAATESAHGGETVRLPAPGC